MARKKAEIHMRFFYHQQSQHLRRICPHLPLGVSTIASVCALSVHSAIFSPLLLRSSTQWSALYIVFALSDRRNFLSRADYVRETPAVCRRADWPQKN